MSNSLQTLKMVDKFGTALLSREFFRELERARVIRIEQGASTVAS